MRTTLLHSGWEFKLLEAEDFPRSQIPKPAWMPASVPGCVHLDLMANGVIPDPFKDKFEAGLIWVDTSDWQYRCTFEWKKNSFRKRVLRFEGLDTVAQIYLNGALVGESNNFYLPLEIDVTDALVEGLNELRIEFRSAVRVGVERRREYFKANGLDWQTPMFDERAFVRKPGYMFGWDWGPRLVGCGIWEPVKLLEYDARITDFRVIRLYEGNWQYRIQTETIIDGESPVSVRYNDTQAGEYLDLKLRPSQWFPHGIGEQCFYEVEAKLPNGHSITKQVGFCTTELIREPDQYGQSFEFAVNGIKIWCGGANWIPDDSFPSRISEDRYKKRIHTCKDLNFNMLRVWGGGLYESEAFYDACDRAGILVWQDFPYACSYYPDDETACAEAKREAEHHIKRLRDRTCLALWCGNNENLAMWEQKWGGADKSPARYHGENIYNGTLKQAVAELDPNHAYIESSPISAGPHDKEHDPNADGFGDQHYWNVWHGAGDWKYYEESRGRFASEFGFASSCSMAQWRQALTGGADVSKKDPIVRWHDKTNKPFELYDSYVSLHYPESESLEDWVYYSQLNQRDALRFAIEHYRSSEFCRGSLIWQFNDCWPVDSWAVQDYAGFLKPAAFELERLYAEDMIALKQDAELLSAVVERTREIPDEWRRPRHRDFRSESGSSLPRKSITAHMYSIRTGELIQTQETAAIKLAELSRDAAICFTIADEPQSARWALFDEPKNVNFGEPHYRAHGDTEVTVDVKGLAYDLIIRDAEDASNMPLYKASPGAKAITAVNESITYKFALPPRRLLARCLWGQKIVEVD